MSGFALIKCMSFLGALPESVWCAGHQHHDTVIAEASPRRLFGGELFADYDQLRSCYMILGPHHGASCIPLFEINLDFSSGGHFML